MKFLHFILAISILVVSCSSKEKSNTKSETQEVETNKVIGDQDCILQSDSILIENFVTNLITEIEAENFDKIALRMVDESNFKSQFSEDEEFIKSLFSAYHYNEKVDLLIPVMLENSEINKLKMEGSDCYFIQIGLQTGLILDLVKVDASLKISKFDMAG